MRFWNRRNKRTMLRLPSLSTTHIVTLEYTIYIPNKWSNPKYQIISFLLTKLSFYDNVCYYTHKFNFKQQYRQCHYSNLTHLWTNIDSGEIQKVNGPVKILSSVGRIMIKFTLSSGVNGWFLSQMAIYMDIYKDILKDHWKL